MNIASLFEVCNSSSHLKFNKKNINCNTTMNLWSIACSMVTKYLQSLIRRMLENLDSRRLQCALIFPDHTQDMNFTLNMKNLVIHLPVHMIITVSRSIPQHLCSSLVFWLSARATTLLVFCIKSRHIDHH